MARKHTTLIIRDEDKALIETADALHAVLLRLNAHGGRLSLGFSPREGAETGAFWHAEQALRMTLEELLEGEEEDAQIVLSRVWECGEAPSWVLRNHAWS